MLRFLPFVLKNLLRKKTRTILTVGSISAPVFLVAFMATFLRTLNRPTRLASAASTGLVTRHKGRPYDVAAPGRHEPDRAARGVRAITPIDRFAGLHRDASAGNVFPRFAVDPEKFPQVFDDAKIVQARPRSGGRDSRGRPAWASRP
ncbi:MAG: hypothetical protein IPL89_04505 [Acidobacteria bacterium]|nr:hypothetical protein [Acidobacteriota bacterium]